MEDTSQKDYGKGFAKIACMVGDDHGHDNRHRAGGARNLGICATKYRGEEPDGDRPVKPGNGADTGGDAKSQRQRQSDYSRCQPAINVASKGL